jgi:hypothetical protein
MGLPILTEGGLEILTEGGLPILTEGTTVVPPPPVVSTEVGSQADIVNRMQRLQPPGWFAPGAVPIRDGLLAGIANAFAFVFSLFTYLKLQTRIATATDGFLDMIAGDFLGNQLLRSPNQSDTSYRAQIQAALFPQRNTRGSIIAVLTQITGKAPIVFEPWRPADTGGYNQGSLAYNTAGGYGSRQYPFQSFVTAYRPRGAGVPYLAGYGIPTGAYNTASQLAYVNPELLSGEITDADIFAAVEGVRMAGTTIWLRLVPEPA